MDEFNGHRIAVTMVKESLNKIQDFFRNIINFYRCFKILKYVENVLIINDEMRHYCFFFICDFKM